MKVIQHCNKQTQQSNGFEYSGCRMCSVMPGGGCLGCRSWKDLGKETGKDFPLVPNETTRRVGGMQISHSNTILRGGLMNRSKVEAVRLDGGCRTLQLKAVHP